MIYILHIFKSKVILSEVRGLRVLAFATTGKDDPRIKQALDRCKRYRIEIVDHADQELTDIELPPTIKRVNL